MGFLSGVLGAVKDDDAVKTYDKDITPNINTVISKLKSQIGSGREGLAVAVDAVKGWLEGYLMKRSEKTENVKKPLNELIRRIASDKHQIAKDKTTDLSQQIYYWTERADCYIQKVTEANNALEYVDSKLKDKLTFMIKMLLQATKTFREAGGNEDLEIIHELAGTIMKETVLYADMKFREKAQWLHRHLNNHIGSLRRRIDNMHKIQCHDLQYCVEQDLDSVFKLVKAGINEAISKYGSDVLTNVRSLKESSERLDAAISITKKAVDQAVQAVETDIGNVSGLSGIEQLKDRNGVTVVTPLLTAVKNNSVFDGVSAYIQQLDTDVMSAVKAAVVKICSGMNKHYTYHVFLKDLKSPLMTLQKIVQTPNSTLAFSKVTNELKQYLGTDGSGLESMNFNVPGGLVDIQSIIAKLDKSDRIETKNELQSLLIFLAEVAKAVSKHSKDVVLQVIDVVKDKVENEITEVASAIGAKVATCKSLLTKSTVDVSDHGLKHVLEPVAGLQKLVDDFKLNIDSALGQLKQRVGTENDDLEALTVYGRLNELKDMILRLGNTVQESNRRVKALEMELTGCINDANTLLENAPRKANTLMEMLKKEVNEKIHEAFRDVQHKASYLYTERKTKEVTALQKIVNEQFTDIKQIIDADKQLGLKGYLKKLNEGFMPPLSSFTRPSSRAQLPEKQLSDFAPIVKDSFKNFYDDLRTQPDLFPTTPCIDAISKALSTLLATLTRYDHTFTKNLAKVKSEIEDFAQQTYANTAQKVSRSLIPGLRNFVKELEKAYVKVYDGGQTIQWDDKTEQQYGAKIFCTISPMLLDTLSELRRRCKPGGQWKDHPINLHEIAADYSNGYQMMNPLGAFLNECGYRVSRTKQDGELRNKEDFKGSNIHSLFKNGETYLVRVHDENGVRMHGMLKTLCNYIKHFYEVCHLQASSTKHPSSIYQMLTWLTGLPHNTVYNDLSLNGFGSLFEKPDEDNDTQPDDFISLKDETADSLPAYPQNITAADLSETLVEVCHHAEQTLIAILGHGHSGGIYACDFNTNTHKLYYPNDGNKCLDLLVEILNRVFHQLSFLHYQCTYETGLSGWRDCLYGKQVGGSDWRCNDLQCANQRCDQKHNQNGEQHYNCGIKSPLQSFLEDGLAGFLPHPYNKADCKMTCSLSNHHGIPCETPMGFGDIAAMASHRQSGEHILNALQKFCGKSSRPLNRLCSLLSCLFTTPPKTLGDMFAFYYCFLNKWNENDTKRKEHRETAFQGAVRNANFGDASIEFNVSHMFESATHKGTSTTHVKGDLFMLVKCNGEKAALDPVCTCGPYLKPLCEDVRNIYSKEHADKYLSWIVYLTETFYDLLSRLLEDCKSKCGSPQSRCQRQTCVKNCRAVISSTESPSLNHDARCKSIVQCKASLPNLYKYGFYYGNTTDLSGTYGETTKRTCSDFCKALEKVLNKEEHRGHALAKLVFKTIPEFLFKIREPFIWLNVALWSLSLFYLICVMVGRLDVLHIRSHLRIPSSHKITAQSLLAAAQVGRLAKISYLQP